MESSDTFSNLTKIGLTPPYQKSPFLKFFLSYSQLYSIDITKSSFHIEDFESSKFLSLIGEDTIISQIGPPSLAQSNESKSSMWKELLVLVNHESQNRQFQMDMLGRDPTT